MFRGTYPGKPCCRKNSLLFLSTSGFELIFCDLLSEVFKPSCQICNLRNHNNILGKHILFWINLFFSPLSEFLRKIWDLLRKVSGHFLKNVFALSRGKIWRKTIFHHVCFSNKIFFDFRRKSFGSVVKTALYVSGGNFCGIFCLHSNWIKPFWILTKSSRQVFKVAVSMSTGISWRKCFFLCKKNIFSASLAEFCQKKHQNQAKFSRQVCRICILRFQWKAYEQTRFRKNFSIIFHFRTLNVLFFWTKNLGQGCHNNIVNVQKKRSRKGLFLRNSYFFYDFRSRSQKISAFCRKLFNRVVKNAFYMSRGKFWGKKFFMFYFVPSFSDFRRKFTAIWRKNWGSVVKMLF